MFNSDLGVSSSNTISNFPFFFFPQNIMFSCYNLWINATFCLSFEFTIVYICFKVTQCRESEGVLVLVKIFLISSNILYISRHFNNKWYCSLTSCVDVTSGTFTLLKRTFRKEYFHAFIILCNPCICSVCIILSNSPFQTTNYGSRYNASRTGYSTYPRYNMW